MASRQGASSSLLMPPSPGNEKQRPTYEGKGDQKQLGIGVGDANNLKNNKYSSPRKKMCILKINIKLGSPEIPCQHKF